ACCIVILLYVQSEVGYDAYHEKKDQIYRLTLDVEGLKSGNGWNHRTADRLNDSQFPGD
nr:hypothetical protein [Gammaproteobacteria bacterium]NIW48045.1 hypothetical protein [Gammaproteobacteria bacterium]NIX58612.1 hypothetical protein [candidate division Zixibacteria bacterium]